ncbi:MAG: hypothetical protein HN509_02480 [Halobacteriovoraceae bacterium]|jgi:hypothetical protein|nr:hypothetical protein [Halobacteriovoraceae bacterium]MBT5093052.1 hypothetical protein [Halobacteriovoraceae bacterium]
MISLIKEVLSIILFLIFLGGAGSISLQKTSKWIKREAIIKVDKGLSPLSNVTKALTPPE